LNMEHRTMEVLREGHAVRENVFAGARTVLDTSHVTQWLDWGVSVFVIHSGSSWTFLDTTNSGINPKPCSLLRRHREEHPKCALCRVEILFTLPDLFDIIGDSNAQFISLSYTTVCGFV
jgi:hypothetical protein